MIEKEWLKKVRHIEMKAFRLVEDLMAGQYLSVFKGRGMDFDEVREYEPGDDVRHIDWNVTARTGNVHVKKYIEEREMTVMLLVDISGSKSFGSVSQSKRELAAELAAVLALSAVRNNDKVGLLLFSDCTEKYIRPKKGRSHVMRIIAAILSHQPARRGTRISAALHHVSHALSRRTTMFLISDFMDQGFERALRIVGRKHDLVAVPVWDAGERDLADAGLVLFEDAETGEVHEVDTSDPQVRQVFAKGAEDRLNQLKHTFRRAGVDSIEIQTDQPYLKAVIRFFETRFHRMYHR